MTNLEPNDKEVNSPTCLVVTKSPAESNNFPDSVLRSHVKKHRSNVAVKSECPSSQSSDWDTKPRATTTTGDVEMTNMTDAPSHEAVPPTPRRNGIGHACDCQWGSSTPAAPSDLPQSDLHCNLDDSLQGESNDTVADVGVVANAVVETIVAQSGDEEMAADGHIDGEAIGGDVKEVDDESADGSHWRGSPS